MKENSTILIVCALGIAIGYYYCADILQAEQTQLKHHPYFLTSQQFNYLYFFTYFAQFLLLIPVGILVDIMPLKIVMTTVIVVTICAQTVLGILLDVRGQNYIIFMYIARGVLGICGLSIITIQGKLADKFSKKNYEFIMGLCLNVPYMFNAINSFITASVQSQTDNMPLCFYIGSGFCMISLLFAFWIIIKFLNPEQEETQSSPTVQHPHQQNPGFSLETLKDFKIEFWVIILSIFFTEGSINPVIDNLSDFITKSFGIQSSQVGVIVPILFISLTPFSLILSKFIQHFPSQKRNMMIASRLLYVIALIVLINIPQTDTPTFFNYAVIIIFLVIMSFNWAVFHSILEPGLACFVKERQLGTALGIMGSCMGLCQSLFSLMNITVTTSSKSLLKSYSTLIFYYVIIASISVLLAIWVRVREYDVLDKEFSEENLQASDYAKVGIGQLQ